MSKKVTVACYGALRNYGNDGSMEIAVQPGMTARQVKKAVLAAIKTREASFARDELILDHSVVGCDDGFLADDELITADKLQSLCLLPPVNGG